MCCNCALLCRAFFICGVIDRRARFFSQSCDDRDFSPPWRIEMALNVNVIITR